MCNRYHNLTYTFFISIVFFSGQPQYAYDYSNLNIALCLKYTFYNKICCQGYGQITALDVPTCIPHSTNSEIVIWWCPFRYNHSLRSHSNVKVHIITWLLFLQGRWKSFLSADSTLDY